MPIGILAACLAPGCSVDAQSADGSEEAFETQVEPLCRTGTVWAGGTVPVCWTTAATNVSDFAARSAQVRALVEGTWSRVANVKFTGWGTCGSNTNGIVAITFSPTARPISGTIGATTGAINMTLNNTRADFQAVAVHEFGHVLGYRHEFVRNDNPGTTCPLQNGESVNSSCDVAGTAFDANSIMASTGYCQSNPSLSDGDVLGTRVIYGVPTRVVRGAISQDFDGDGSADQVLYRPSSGFWFVRKKAGGADLAVDFGDTDDMPAPGDYDGDKKTDYAVYRPSTGFWFVKKSTGGADLVVDFGDTTDIPVPGDYDGDKKTDYAVYRPSTGFWFVKKSTGGADLVVDFGDTTDIPVPGDYDGDLKTDYAVFRPSTGTWFVKKSTGGSDIVAQFGTASDVPVPADYDGDKKTDYAVFRPSSGTWFVRKSTGGSDIARAFGAVTDRFLPADYDGDGKADMATFRPTDNLWRIFKSTTSTTLQNEFGVISDVFPNSR